MPFDVSTVEAAACSYLIHIFPLGHVSTKFVAPSRVQTDNIYSYDLLTMVDIIIEEKTESVDIAYFLIITIFETLLWRIAEVLTLAFIFRLLKTLRSHLAVTSLDSDGDAVITQDLGVSKHPRKPSKYDIITNVFIAILSIMSLAAVTMTAVYVGLLLSQGFRNNGGKYANASRYITIAYYVLYLFGSLYILGLSILYSLKARSKVLDSPLLACFFSSFIYSSTSLHSSSTQSELITSLQAATYLVSLVAPFLILGEALPLASALWLALHNSLSNDQLRLAANIIDTISQIIMYIGLTLMVSTKNPNFA